MLISLSYCLHTLFVLQYLKRRYYEKPVPKYIKRQQYGHNLNRRNSRRQVAQSRKKARVATGRRKFAQNSRRNIMNSGAKPHIDAEEISDLYDEVFLPSRPKNQNFRPGKFPQYQTRSTQRRPNVQYYPASSSLNAVDTPPTGHTQMGARPRRRHHPPSYPLADPAPPDLTRLVRFSDDSKRAGPGVRRRKYLDVEVNSITRSPGHDDLGVSVIALQYSGLNKKAADGNLEGENFVSFLRAINCFLFL